MTAIRVLLAEDHETVRQGLRLLLEAQHDIDVVGEAADGRVAVEKAQHLRPHVVILDLSMPEMGGLEAAKAIKRVAPDVRIVALTRHDDEAFVKELVAVGTAGYVLKQSRSTELLNAVRVVAGGGNYMDSTLLARANAQAAASEAGGTGRSVVSDREAEVLRLMAIGHSNKEIADRLGISVKTVEVHKTNVMRKLGFRGRIDVVRYAVLQGWLREA
jgi:two-component system response regulator NreC